IETARAELGLGGCGAGVLRKIVVPAGERAPVGALIGVIAEPGEDIAGVLASAPAPPAAPAPTSSVSAPPQPAAVGKMADRPASVPPQPTREDHLARLRAP